MKKIKYVLVVLMIVCCVFSFASCKQETSDTWPEAGLALKLPKPESGNLDITYDGDNSFSASIDGIEKSEYEKYLAVCKKKGFTIDPDLKSSDFIAFNEEGYKLKIYYLPSFSQMHINLDVPIEIGDLKWPIGSAGKAVPEPVSKKGTIQWEYDDKFFAYVGNTAFSDYNSYVDKCIEAGFNIDYSKGDTFYRAENIDHFRIDVEYEGFNIIFVKVEKKDDETEELESSLSKDSIQESLISESNNEESLLPSNTTSDSSETSVNDSTPVNSEPSEKPSMSTDPSQESSAPVESTDNTIIRPEVREAIDSYEAFVDQYCEFMAKYDSSNTEMLNEYMEFLQKEIEVSEKFEAIKDIDLNEAESDYYTVVELRCAKKMLDVVNEMNSQ